jgi:hypothetical protein
MFWENLVQLIVGIAWPAVILGLAFMLRKPIVGLLPRIRSVEGLGIKLILDQVEKEGQLPFGSRAELSGLTPHDIWALHSFEQKEIPVEVVKMRPMQRVAARTLYDAGLLSIHGEDTGRHVELTELGQKILDAARSVPL